MTNQECLSKLKNIKRRMTAEFPQWDINEIIDVIGIAIETITILPSTNIPKGKWEFEGYNMFVCSHCGVIYTTEQLNNLRNYDSDPYLPFYCPKCGADMRYEVGYDE